MEDFLPDYPPLQDDDFFRQIVEKKEFWTESNRYFYQTNIARYMSQWTIYDSILLFHEMGTGKSATTISLVDQFRREEVTPGGKVLYIAHNQTQIDNYKKEILTISGRLRAELDKQVFTDPVKRMSRWDTILYKDGYLFYTMGTIHSKFSKMKDADILASYDHSILIIDEAHHLVQVKQDKEEGKKSYDTILRLLSLLPHKKLIVMTGTPIRDQPDEIVPLLNLILPIEHRIPSRVDFISGFFDVMKKVQVLDNRTLDIYGWKEGARERFARLIRGKISYIRLKSSETRIEYVGQVYPPMDNLQLCVHTMNPMDIQNEIYLDVFDKERGVDPEEEEEELEEEIEEEEESAMAAMATGFAIMHKAKPKMRKICVYSKSKQASLFVFPDRSIGKTGFRKYVTANYTMNDAFIQPLFRPSIKDISVEQRLDILSQFSIVYADVIREILAHPEEVVYIFSDLVTGSGILLFMSLMKSIFGFSLVRSPADFKYTTGDRMMLLNDSVTKEEDFQEMIHYFNDRGNRHADYCQVIMSTNKTKEGISLKNVRQIHILTPSWNMGDTAQAMARSLRSESHTDLENPVVKIFLHAAVPFIPISDEEAEEPAMPLRASTEEERLSSIDFQRYYRTEIKEKNSKLVERVFLESSWDCAMNMPINSKTGRLIDYSRECEYDICQYRCDGISETTPFGSDPAGFNVFYSDMDKDLILRQLQDMYKKKSAYCIEEIREECSKILSEPSRVHAETLILECVMDIITMPLLLRDRKNRPCFLTMSGGYFYLIDNPYLAQQNNVMPFAYYYQENPSVCVSYEMNDLLDSYYLGNIQRLVPRLLRLIHAKNRNARGLFLAFPLSFQALFCEISIQEELINPDKVTVPLRQWFIDNFKTDINHMVGSFIDHRFVTDKTHPRRLLLNSPEKGWTTM